MLVLLPVLLLLLLLLLPLLLPVLLLLLELHVFTCPRCLGPQDKLSTLSDGYDRRGRPVRVATTRRTRSLEETGAALAMQRARTRRKYAAAAESARWP